ncbi:amino acid ABC transporter permease [Isobaculum melis]|uniref:Amino acid ABC transporter membrane protein 1, PAAT family n=1 Tax=Isobaculum melis TaxID=142588 RepID=A0A1H9QTN2_9LACT|nr:amino acid ABC transporter permease [Isobaculum melis]SER63073.1 amino acid ABC transporter membrane protein 1, PAAT family [Isobaculum melis]
MLQLFMDHSGEFLEGLKYTLLSSVIALIFSLIIGILIAIFQISHSKPLRIVAKIYVEFFRNIPLLIIAMFFYVVVPMFWFKLDGFTAGTIGLTIYTSAFIAETIRAGILAVPPGQLEAARSSGFSYVQAMWYIVLPQAIKIVIPPLGNQFINLIKNSSILAVVTGLDLMYQGDLIASATFNTFDTYMIVALLYLILTLPLSIIMNRLEKKFAVNG